MDIRFRQASAVDYAATRALVREAFQDHMPEETAAFLDALRRDECILGEWLAEDATGLLAHIVFSRVWVEQQSGNRVHAAMLTPLAVRPDRQREGLGTNLMNFALEALERCGETLFLVLGHPTYYPRVGFQSALAVSIESPYGKNSAFMARGLSIPVGRLVLPKSIAAAP
jgi:putative acetyltransferase